MKNNKSQIKITQLIIALLLFVIADVSFAKSKKVKSPKKIHSNLSTNLQFEGSQVGGKYHIPDEGRVSVENEKSLSGLIGPRLDFKDRLNTMGKQR